MRSVNGGGDQLARGAVRMTYGAASKTTSDEKWNSIFDSYDPEAYKNAPNPAQVRHSNPGGEETGVVSTDVGEAVSSAPAPVDTDLVS